MQIIEPRTGWLAGKQLAAVAMALLFVAIAVLGFGTWRAKRPNAAVPILSLSGPLAAARDSTVRYAVFAQDRKGSALASTVVKVGFWKNGRHVELARTTTDASGSGVVDVHFPSDFNETRALVAIASASGITNGAA